MSLKSWFRALEDAGGFWLGFGIYILILIRSLIFHRVQFQILALYLDFEGAKIIHVPKVLTWDFGGCWWFLTGVWDHDLNFDMVIGLWYTHVPYFSSLFWFLMCKEHPDPLHLDLGLWRMPKVSDWELGYWYWFRYNQLII